MTHGAFINIGCGNAFHPAWINLDAHPSHASVRQCDIRHGLPFRNEEADVCYASHVLEHLSRRAAQKFVSECYRVLRRGGILRIAVPDLERIARLYLELLNKADQGEPGSAARYDWIMMEMFDQVVRSQSGGEMARCLAESQGPIRSFIQSRVGLEACNAAQSGTLGKPHIHIADRLRSVTVKQVQNRVAQAVLQLIALLLGGRDLKSAVKEGIFRNSGEVHQWMYDRFSLGRLLQDAGFVDVWVCEATESRIPDFGSYNFDAIGDRVRKPDSLFIEGRKP